MCKYLSPFVASCIVCITLLVGCQQPAAEVSARSAAVSTVPTTPSTRSHDGKTVQVRERGLLVDEFSAADLTPPGSFAPSTWYNISYPRRLATTQPRAGATHVADFRTDSNGEIVPFDARGGAYLLADGVAVGDLGGDNAGSIDLSAILPPAASSVALRAHCHPGPTASVSFLPGPRSASTSVQSGEFVTLGDSAHTERLWVPVGDGRTLNYFATGSAWSITVSVVGYSE